MANVTSIYRPGWSRNRGVLTAPALSGGIIEVPGKHGRAWQIAEAATNLMTNPRFVAGGAQWVYSGLAHSDDGTLTPLGIPTRRVEATAAGLVYLYQVTLAATAATNAGHSGRYRVKASRSGISMRIQLSFRDAAGTTIQTLFAPYSYTVAGEWVDVTATNVVPTVAGVDNCYMLLRLGEVAGAPTAGVIGDVYHIGEPYLEQRVYLTPYLDAMMGAGHAWSGTVNASSSTRSGGYPYIAMATAETFYTVERGAVVYRAKVPLAVKTTTSRGMRHGQASGVAPTKSGYMDQWAAGSTSALVNVIYQWWHGASVLHTLTVAGVPRGANISVYLGWSGGLMEMAVWHLDEGYMIGTASISTRNVPSTLFDTIMYPGGGSQAINTFMDSWATFDDALSASERDAVLSAPQGWSWASLGGAPASPILPARQSGVYIMAPRIYQSDMQNRRLADITHLVTKAGGDTDIDRAGPKAQFKIDALDPDVVAPRTWVAPYLDIIPEQGATISAQRGLFELGEPTVTYTAYGDVLASNAGEDIICVLQRQVLTASRETAVGAPIMATILTELSLLGIDRHAMPADVRTATTAIVTKAGATWLERINQQLAALGMHAIYALPDGRPTTRPQREPQRDTPARIYRIGLDARVVGDIQTKRATSRPYNVIVAVKEDYQAGTAIVETARNTDPDHPWSVQRIGESSPSSPITSSDAVDAAALRAIAEATLARVSVQETLSLDVLPDPDLSVHDVIELTDGDDRVNGRWAIEKIAEGSVHSDPLVNIEARRIITMSTAGAA